MMVVDGGGIGGLFVGCGGFSSECSGLGVFGAFSEEGDAPVFIATECGLFRMRWDIIEFNTLEFDITMVCTIRYRG
jgi:hypothetical protein